MRTNQYFLFLLLASVLFGACKQRYGYIPRSLNLTKQEHAEKGFSHYVSPSKKDVADSVAPTTPGSTSNTALPPTQKITEPIGKQTLRTKPLNLLKPFRKTSPRTAVDSTKEKPKRRKDLASGSGFFFAAVAVLNASILFTPYVNTLFLSILIGLGAFVIGYLLIELAKNIRKNRLRPTSTKTYKEARERLKRVVGILFIVSGSFFLIGVLSMAAGIFGLGVFCFVMGAIAFYAALLGGLIYLLMGI
ncbi:MAG: hypothetical protein JJ975_17780 [Bacteroidia bacterium]|nr:hypothetical protein [Bacteroidia bacterium]